jgi:hypothetical protein
MLFHFSFYSNKQPAVPACSHNHSVELGEYHLSKVKFPGKVASQSRLSISELIPASESWCNLPQAPEQLSSLPERTGNSKQ